MTYNIRGCIGMDNQMSVERIAEVIRESHARVVCLQEVHTLRKVSQFTDQPIELARLLNMRVAFQVNYREGAGGLGNAILTTLEVEHTRSHILTSKGEQRGFLEVGLRAPEGAFTVFATHLGLNEEERLTQVKEISAVMNTVKNPKVICGDLNAEPNSECVSFLIDTCRLADADAAGELTFDSNKPTVRIDYVLPDPALKVMGTKIMRSHASDHLPLIADLSML